MMMMSGHTHGHVNIVKPPVGNNPKCQARVVAYRRWSFMRAQITLGQNVASLACVETCPMSQSPSKSM